MISFRIGILAAAMLLATHATAAGEERRHLDWNDGDYRWTSRPSGGDMARLFPKEAWRNRISGSAVVGCTIQENGRLTGCEIVTETPEGHGFGAAALRLADEFRAAPAKKGGAPVAGGYVTIPILMMAQGKPPPTPVYGDRVFLLTPATRADAHTMPCPAADAPNRLCELREFNWAKAPPLYERAALFRQAGLRDGMTVVQCGVGAQGVPSGCSAGGAGLPEDHAKVAGLMAQFTAPEKTPDGAPLIGASIVVIFDWKTMHKVFDVVAPQAATAPAPQ